MKNRFDLIIFDWDGTLIDSIDWIVHCIQRAAARQECRVPEPRAVKDIIGLSIENALDTLFPNVDADIRQRISTDYSEAFFLKQIGRTDLFPGVYEMLQQFKREGYRLAIATGKKSTGLAQAIEATGVANLFCTTRCSDQTASKPNPLMIEEIVAELGISKDRTLMVGDSVHDLEMARNAEVSAIGVSCGAHSETRLKQYNPLFCLNSPTDLMNLI